MRPRSPQSPEGKRRPYVVVNMAMTADGKIATTNRAVTSFGSPRDARHLMELRASADAILCGAGTVNEAGITLGLEGEAFLRQRRGLGLSGVPLRVVVSGRARVRPDADVFRTPGGPVVVIASRAAPESVLRELRRHAGDVVIFGKTEVDIVAALHWLYATRGVRRLVGEGGAELNDALFRADVVDEFHVTLCPKLFGGRTAPTVVEGLGLPRLAEARRFAWRSCRRVGGEIFAVLERLPRAAEAQTGSARGNR